MNDLLAGTIQLNTHNRVGFWGQALQMILLKNPPFSKCDQVTWRRIRLGAAAVAGFLNRHDVHVLFSRTFLLVVMFLGSFFGAKTPRSCVQAESTAGAVAFRACCISHIVRRIQRLALPAAPAK